MLGPDKVRPPHMEELLQSLARIRLAQQRSNLRIISVFLGHLVSEYLEHLGGWFSLRFRPVHHLNLSIVGPSQRKYQHIIWAARLDEPIRGSQFLVAFGTVIVKHLSTRCHCSAGQKTRCVILALPCDLLPAAVIQAIQTGYKYRYRFSRRRPAGN